MCGKDGVVLKHMLQVLRRNMHSIHRLKVVRRDKVTAISIIAMILWHVEKLGKLRPLCQAANFLSCRR
jgi:hypothetical protein